MKGLKLIALGAAVVSFTSCGFNGEVEYDPNYRQELLKQQFSKNFESQYGKIDPEQSWDLAENVPLVVLSESAVPKLSLSRAGTINPVVTSSDGFNFNISSEFMTEAANVFADPSRTWSGEEHSFYCMMPDGPLKITTVYQDANNQYVLWVTAGTGSNAVNFPTLNSSKTINMNQKQGKTMYITGIPPRTPLYFHIVAHSGKNTYSYPTLEGKMPLIDGIHTIGSYVDGTPISKDATIMACKASESSNSVKVNAAFLIEGVPGEDIQTPVDDIERVESKRYMIEDLGSTNDFDFNDIVIDVKQVTTYEDRMEVSRKQTATLVHLGGTLSWNAKIGDTWFSGSESKMIPGELGVDKNQTVEITGWIPFGDNGNNVTVIVESSDNKNDGVNTIPFPKKGTAPMIIAVSNTQQWMKERESVPAEWWTTTE